MFFKRSAAVERRKECEMLYVLEKKRRLVRRDENLHPVGKMRLQSVMRTLLEMDESF